MGPGKIVPGHPIHPNMVTTRRDCQRRSPASSRGNATKNEPRAQGRCRTQCLAIPERAQAQETVTSPAKIATATPVITTIHVQQPTVTAQPVVEDHPLIVGLIAVIDDLQKQNQALQQRMDHLQQERDPNSLDSIPIEKPQPLTDAIMTDSVPAYFKPPPLEGYDSKKEPQEHITGFDTQMAINGALDTLKCKLFSRTMKGPALRWFMSLPRKSITSYADFTKKFIRHFSDRRHRKTTTATLFNTRQWPSESLRKYLGRFSDITVDVENPDQRQFANAFTNGLRGRQFNESLA